jgi:hypothetical protein
MHASMQTPKLPGNESQRLQALRDHRILDTAAEANFDGITKLATRLLGVPIALISIVDADRQWFKSRFGSAPQTPRDISFCGHVVEHDCPVIVPDARADTRFADNPLVSIRVAVSRAGSDNLQVRVTDDGVGLAAPELCASPRLPEPSSTLLRAAS